MLLIRQAQPPLRPLHLLLLRLASTADLRAAIECAAAAAADEPWQVDHLVCGPVCWLIPQGTTLGRRPRKHRCCCRCHVPTVCAASAEAMPLWEDARETGLPPREALVLGERGRTL